MTSRTRMIDDGTLSPKVAIPTALLALAGIALMILDTTGILALEDGVWIAVLSAGGVTFSTGYAARPGQVMPDPEHIDALRGQRGYSIVELLVILLLGVLVIFAVVALVQHLR